MATAVSATVCAAPAQAISGGTPTDIDGQPFLVKIDIGSTASCSGALIAPRWIATSAACFAEIPSQPEIPAPGAPHSETTAMVNGKSITVDRIVPREDRDLVLAHLRSPVTGVAPLKIAAVAPAPSDTVQISGYGRTAEEWIPRQSHTGDFAVQAVDSSMLSLQGTTEETSVCKGDAGGPVLRGGELVAVAGGSHQAGCVGEVTEQRGAVAARVDDLAKWITSQVVDLKATPATKNAINLTWDTPDPSLTYRVYGAQSEHVAIAPENLLAETTESHFVHGSLPSGQPWSYRVALIDQSGTQVAISFTAHAESPTSTVTDFNGDGLDDIATFSGGRATVALSDGEQFGSPQRWHDFLGGAEGTRVLAGDVNGDSLDDAVIFTRGNYGYVAVALSTGSSFGATRLWNGQFAGGTRAPSLGDFNGDGKDDIASFGGNGDGIVWVSLSDGEQFLHPNQQWHSSFALPGETPVVGDFNDDGLDDIASFLGGTEGKVYVSLSTGTTFTETAELWHDRFGRSPEWAGAADINGDGKSDAVTYTRGDNANVWTATSDGTAFGPSTQWHDNFAAGDAHHVPSSRPSLSTWP
ncbi:FG-GAP-like repeat-containing protein [Saccharomonospora cyanea]|nr:FG-GAP-like repeat-containing protein [Saccharomonospora cyanea]